VLAAIAAATLLLSSCSGGDDSRGASSKSGPTTTAPPVSTSGAREELCALFAAIAAGAQAAKSSPDDPAAIFTAEQWQQKIATTAQVVDVAPSTYRAAAETYLQLVKDRAGLAAAHDYGPIPADALQQFMATHRDQQTQANVLLAYVKQSCAGLRSG
jgi:hypothetical protein